MNLPLLCPRQKARQRNMKLRYSIFLWIVAGWIPATSMQAQATSINIAVISDVHVMAPSLLIKEGSAFDNYVKHDRKMLKESPALLEELTGQLLKARPQFVLLTGDLTKDGEEVSHHYLVEHCLNPLKEAGIPTLVIPGNHDINNPHAVSFYGDSKERVTCISPEEFAGIYADFGYREALARDKYSLSYVYQLTPEIRILALDACKYEENDFDKDICRHDGRIKPETMAFIKSQMADARSKGIRVLGMMHHGLIEHWKYQNKVIPGYVIDDRKKIRKALAKEGLQVLFTGHAHAQDIVYDKGIYDIETGSLVSYPSPFRMVTLEDHTLTLHSHTIRSIPYDTKGADFRQYARAHTAEGFKTVAASMFPDKVPAELKEKAVKLVAEAMSDHYQGDETLTEEKRKEIKETGKALRKYSFKWSMVFKMVTNSLWSDKKPADNELIITLKK